MWVQQPLNGTKSVSKCLPSVGEGLEVEICTPLLSTFTRLWPADSTSSSRGTSRRRRRRHFNSIVDSGRAQCSDHMILANLFTSAALFAPSGDHLGHSRSLKRPEHTHTEKLINNSFLMWLRATKNLCSLLCREKGNSLGQFFI